MFVEFIWKIRRVKSLGHIFKSLKILSQMVCIDSSRNPVKRRVRSPPSKSVARAGLEMTFLALNRGSWLRPHVQLILGHRVGKTQVFLNYTVQGYRNQKPECSQITFPFCPCFCCLWSFSFLLQTNFFKDTSLSVMTAVAPGQVIASHGQKGKKHASQKRLLVVTNSKPVTIKFQ